jgi:hypothetical protein
MAHCVATSCTALRRFGRVAHLAAKLLVRAEERRARGPDRPRRVREVRLIDKSKSNQIKPNPIKPIQIKSNQIKSNQIK